MLMLIYNSPHLDPSVRHVKAVLGRHHIRRNDCRNMGVGVSDREERESGHQEKES